MGEKSSLWMSWRRKKGEKEEAWMNGNEASIKMMKLMSSFCMCYTSSVSQKREEQEKERMEGRKKERIHFLVFFHSQLLHLNYFDIIMFDEWVWRTSVYFFSIIYWVEERENRERNWEKKEKREERNFHPTLEFFFGRKNIST